MPGCVTITPSIKLAVSSGILEADVKVSATAANALSILSDGLFVAAAPTGTVVAFAGAAAPSGWLICDGSLVLRSTFAALHTAIGDQYGGGDGVTTFQIPDARGRTVAGFVPAGGRAEVSTLGSSDGVALASRSPQHLHTHTLTLPNHGHSDTITYVDLGHVHGGGFALTGANTVDSTNHYQIDRVNTDTGFANLSKSGGVGNPTSNPAINGGIGLAGGAADAPAFIVFNWIIKT